MAKPALRAAPKLQDGASATAYWRLSDGALYEKPADYNPFEEVHPNLYAKDLQIWRRIRDEILGEWTVQFPCTRPEAWWTYDAKEYRRRLGGVGDPVHEYLNVAPEYKLGIPCRFIHPWDEALYNGRNKNFTNNGKWFEGHFKGRAIDPANPPQYESQAAYLERHNVLTPAERAHLFLHAELLTPEIVLPATDPESLADE